MCCKREKGGVVLKTGEGGAVLKTGGGRGCVVNVKMAELRCKREEFEVALKTRGGRGCVENRRRAGLRSKREEGWVILVSKAFCDVRFKLREGYVQLSKSEGLP